MATLTLGTPAQFDSSEARSKSVCRLTDTKFVIAFADVTDSDKGKVIIGTLSGTTITISDDTAITFESGATDRIEIKRIDDTHFAIAFRDVPAGNHLKGIIGSVSGTTITMGAVVSFLEPAAGYSAGVTVLDSTYLVFFFSGTGFNVGARLCSVSGITITKLGSDTEIGTGTAAATLKTTTMDPTHFIVLPGRIGGSGNMSVRAAVVDTGGATITPGNSIVWTAGVNDNVSIDSFDSRFFIMAHHNDVRPAELEGTTITLGNAVELEADADSPAVFCLTSTQWGCAYFDDADSDKGKVTLGSHSTKVLNKVDEANEFEPDDTDNLAACRMTDEYFITAYRHA